jgi:ribosome maturation factor RimP
LLRSNKPIIFAPEKAVRRERNRSLLLLSGMNAETEIKELEKIVAAAISDDPSLFLVNIKIKPTNNIKVFIDGDQGVSIEKLVHYNRKLYRQMEAENMYGGNFSLEISSPGLDEPLKLHRQYIKNTGRFVEVMTVDGNNIEGKMTNVLPDGIVVETVTGKGKKTETIPVTVLFDQIKTTKVQIKF